MSKLIYFRYLLMAPATIITLGAFALYFGVRNAGYFRKGPGMVLWGATAGLLTFSTNVLFTLTAATFIWWRLPPLFNTKGEFSPYTTTRLKALRREGDELAEHLSRVINLYDPEHFS